MMKIKSIYDRVAAILANDFEGLEPVWTRQGLCKKWLASVIGCQVSRLSSDPRLGRMLKDWEAFHRTPRCVDRSGRSSDPGTENCKVLALQAARKERDAAIHYYIEQFRSLGLPEVDL